MTEGKSINLLKAAKELNIGIGTAVDFLGKKGFEVDSKPNTKLSADMYAVLLKEFQGDKIVKDEAKQIVIGKIRREESAAGTGGANPTEFKEDFVEDRPAETQEILVKDTTAPETPSPIEKEVKEEAPKKEDSPLKVVGKIDLDSLNRGKSKKTAEQAPAAPVVEEKKEEEVKPT